MPRPTRPITDADISSGRPLDDPKDRVRIKIQTLLGRDGVPVTPLLLGGAEMPKPEDLHETLRQLPHRQGVPLRPEPEFEDSVRKVIQEIGDLLGVTPKKPFRRPWHTATDPA